MTFALCLLAAGCSATVTHEQATESGTGIRYYDSAPYLLIYSDGRGGLKWQIRYLPDQGHIMMATPTILGGHTEMTLYFQNGILASGSTLGDTTELPKAVIAAVQSALPLLAALEGPAQNGFPAPYLYKLVVRDNELTFIGGQGDTSIQVPINQGQPKS